MNEDYDKREHSTKREVDDLTNYQKLNSLGGAGVAVNPDEVPRLNECDEDETPSITPAPGINPSEGVIVYREGFNDGADFNTVDDEGKTNT